MSVIRRALLVSVYALGDKAYIPTSARMDSGVYLDVEPVQVVELEVERLAVALSEAMSSEHPRRPDMTRDELRAFDSPVLKATGFRTWKLLAKVALAYTIEIDEHSIRLRPTRLDSKGRWEYDNTRDRRFPAAADPIQVSEAILGDLRTQKGAAQAP